MLVYGRRMPEKRLGPTATDLSAETLHDLDPRIVIPRYDRTRLRPGIVHIGVGGFHRAHQAEYLDDLCNDGNRDWSIHGAGVMAADSTMAKALTEQSGLYSLTTRSSRETEVRIIGTITDYLHAHPSIDSLVEICLRPSTRIVSLTITEGGYPIDPATGSAVEASASPAFAAIATALEARRTAGLAPFTVMSCDNVLNNGLVTKTATLGAADELGLDTEWIEREVTFPNSMVDRITPATTDEDRTVLANEYGLIDRWPVFAETFRQWVIEDEFCDGRPPWEDAGALITSDVAPYERLKLRLLNAGHSTLAYLAALVGHEQVHEVMADRLFDRFARRFLNDEAAPVLPPVPGVDVDAYVVEILDRFANPSIRDQVSRLCLDGSSKFPTFLIPTIRAELEAGGPIELSALALAGWCQYLVGKDDAGNEISLAADPKIESAQRHALASIDAPAEFLAFTDVFADIANSERFRKAFEEALISLRSKGTKATLDIWLQRGDMGGSR